MTFTRLVVVFSSFLMLMACASQEKVREDVEEMIAGPSTPPVKTITNFSDGLRCMDNLQIQFGVRDIVILVEDLDDRTTKVNAGTKDMLISAVSAMTRRSRGIKLIAFGNDSGNLVAFLAQAGSQTPYNVLPQYDIRGSVSQLDSSVVRRQEDFAIAATDFGGGPSRSTSGSVLGLDLSVLSTEDMSVIPGVVSSNSVIVFKSGAGLDAEATIEKSGFFYSFFVSKNEGTVQALRNLIELASIELMGKLVRIPYWQCLDIPSDAPVVEQEMEDWFYSMKTHGEIVPYVRTQLRARGFLHPESSEQDLTEAIQKYQTKADLRITGNVDLEFFKALLNNYQSLPITAYTSKPQNKRVPIEIEPELTEETMAGQSVDVAQPSTPEPQVAMLTEPTPDAQVPTSAAIEEENPEPTPNITLTSVKGSPYFVPGEKILLSLALSSPGYVYCFFQDEKSNIQRFFPNRVQKDGFVPAGSSLQLPGKMPFDMQASSTGGQESVSCFATRDELFDRLPPQLKTFDFQDMEITSISELRKSFQAVSDGNVSEARLLIQLQ
jgi:hypothetical protein